MNPPDFLVRLSALKAFHKSLVLSTRSVCLLPTKKIFSAVIFCTLYVLCLMSLCLHKAYIFCMF